MIRKFYELRVRWTPGEWGYIGTSFSRDQMLVMTYRLWGIQLWKRVIDQETIPGYVFISRACLGYCDWTSKFAADYPALFEPWVGKRRPRIPVA